MKSKYTFNEIEEFLDKCNAPGIKILNGTSKQFLKADGSLDTKEYLSTTGGTINGRLTILRNVAGDATPLEIQTTDAMSTLRFRTNGSLVYFGYNQNKGLFVTNNGGWSNEYRILHEGNYVDLIGNTYLKTTGGTISGNLTIEDHLAVGKAATFGDRLLMKAYIRFNQYNEEAEYLLGMTTARGPLRWYDGTQWNTILHSGNYSDIISELNLNLTVKGQIKINNANPSIQFANGNVVYGRLAWNASNGLVMTDSSWNKEYILLRSDNYSDLVTTLNDRLKISSDADAKIILNETGTEVKYQQIAFQDNGVEYGRLGTYGDDQLKWIGKTLLHQGNYADLIGDTYLKTSGGTISGTGVNPLNINTTNESEVGLYFNQNNKGKAWVGYSASAGAGIYDVATKSTLGITIGGVPHFNKKALLHSGNYATEIGDYYLKSSGGKIKGNSSIPLTISQLLAGKTWIKFADAVRTLGFIGFTEPDAFKMMPADGSKEYFILHSGNVGDYALPLTNGQINRIATFVGNKYVQIKPYSATSNGGSWASKGLIYINGDDTEIGGIYAFGNDKALGYLFIGTEAYNGVNLRVGKNLLQWGDNYILHAGNIGKYNAGGVASGVATDDYLQGKVAKAWYDWNEKTGNGTGDYSYGIYVGAYDTGYGMQLATTIGSVSFLRARVKRNSAWEDWKVIAFTDSNVAGAYKLVHTDGASIIYNSGKTFYVGDSIYQTVSTNILGKEIALRYGASATNGLILNSSGNVLIGATEDDGSEAKLQVNGNISLGNAGDSEIFFNRDYINRFIAAKVGGYFAWRVNGSDTDVMTLLTNGNVLIGANEDNGSGAKLQVNGSAVFDEETHKRLYTRIKDSGIQVGRYTSKYTGGANFGLSLGYDYGVVAYIAGVYDDSEETCFYLGGGDSLKSPIMVRHYNKETKYGKVCINGGYPAYDFNVAGTSSLDNLLVSGTSTFGGQSTFNAGITVPSGQSITFVDASGNNHVVSWDDTAGSLKVDDKIITVN